jgi:hypothetical protein
VDIALMPQAAIVEAVAEFARRWRDPADPFRQQAEIITCPFPFAMTRLSLEALLDSLTPETLWALIDAEGVRDAYGPRCISHVIAGNTPLLAWTSLLRALLMRSQSRVKLPSSDTARWGHLFQDSLAAVSPLLASSIELFQWPGGASLVQEREFCESADLVLAYGSDRTIASLHALCPSDTPLIGYGHRVSFGLVCEGFDHDDTAQGLATDILLYDQGGCLSPQTIFVMGASQSQDVFAARLASALTENVPNYPLPNRDPLAAMRVREARVLARMEPETRLWEDSNLRWTVISRPETAFVPSPTHGVVSVQRLPHGLSDLPVALLPVRQYLQGCAVAGPDDLREDLIRDFAISYVCLPGRLQAPPLNWPQDNIPPLRSLMGGDTGNSAVMLDSRGFS